MKTIFEKRATLENACRIIMLNLILMYHCKIIGIKEILWSIIRNWPQWKSVLIIDHKVQQAGFVCNLQRKVARIFVTKLSVDKAPNSNQDKKL